MAHWGAGRLAAFPEVPSLREAGYDVEFYVWAGLFAPNPEYCAASLPVVTGRVEVPTMGDFPFAHLA